MVLLVSFQVLATYQILISYFFLFLDFWNDILISLFLEYWNGIHILNVALESAYLSLSLINKESKRKL